MALRPDIALKVDSDITPALKSLGGFFKDISEDKAKTKELELEGVKGTLQGLMATPQEQRTVAEVKRQVGTLERTLGIDIPEDELLKDVNEDGFIPDSVLKPLATSLGIKFAKPTKVETLTKQELSSAGFPEDAVVQRDPTGALKVVQEGTTPIKKLEEDLKSKKEVLERAKGLRAEVDKVTKTFRDVEDSYTRVISSQEGDITGASDVALVFNYMKMLDPKSVVRETEYATAENTTGVPGKILNTYNKLLDGDRLNPKQRSNFIKEAQKQYKSALRVNKKREKEFLDLAERVDVPGNLVVIRSDLQIPDLTTPVAPPTETPAQQQPTGSTRYDRRRQGIQQPQPSVQDEIDLLKKELEIQ